MTDQKRRYYRSHTYTVWQDINKSWSWKFFHTPTPTGETRLFSEKQAERHARKVIDSLADQEIDSFFPRSYIKP